MSVKRKVTTTVGAQEVGAADWGDEDKHVKTVLGELKETKANIRVCVRVR